MHFLHLSLVGMAWVIAAAWLYRVLEAAWGLPSVPNLTEAKYDVEPVGSPSIAVIVPARNEEANVGACLESLLGQDYADVRIVAVDDRSDDRTGAIMDALSGGGWR